MVGIYVGFLTQSLQSGRARRGLFGRFEVEGGGVRRSNVIYSFLTQSLQRSRERRGLCGGFGVEGRVYGVFIERGKVV